MIHLEAARSIEATLETVYARLWSGESLAGVAQCRHCSRIFIATGRRLGLVSGHSLFPEGPMRVLDLIGSRKEVFSIAEDLTVHEAARYLRDKQVRSVGVVDSGGRLVGVVSQSDISDKVAAENKCPAWMRVKEIMTKELITVTSDMPLEDCLRLMEKHGMYHLLVVDERQGFRGMLSVTDLLQVIASDEKARADMLESFIFPQR